MEFNRRPKPNYPTCNIVTVYGNFFFAPVDHVRITGISV